MLVRMLLECAAVRVLLSIAAVLGACGGGDAGHDGGAGPDGGAGECAWSTAPAQFTIESRADWGGFGGQYRDLPWPVTAVEQARAGECAYFGAANAFCDPPCGGSEVCVAGGTCQAWPTGISAGHLSVSGTTPPLELDPQAGFNYYTTESYPDLFGPGDLVTLQGAGSGPVAPFELSVRGVPALTVPWTVVTAREGQDLDIPWDPAGSPDGSLVVVHMDSDHHGIEAYVECVAADDGGVTVDAAVLDRLIEAGETGIGTYIENAWIARVHATAVDTASGCVSFRAEARLQMSVETVRQ